MSHHFDTPTAKQAPRINVCDFYLFRGRPGTTVMALDMILTLATNTALGDGVAPDKRLMRPDFHYFGEPHATTANSAKH